MKWKIEIYLNSGSNRAGGDWIHKFFSCLSPGHPALLLVQTKVEGPKEESYKDYKKEEEPKEESYLVSYGMIKKPGKWLEDPVKDEINSCCLPNPIRVYIEQVEQDKPPLQKFVEIYEEKFKVGEFNWIRNNCSDAGMFTLNYFLGSQYLEKILKYFSLILNMGSCLGYCLTGWEPFFGLTLCGIGVNSFSPCIPGITSPREVNMVFAGATALKCCYGSFSRSNTITETEKTRLVAPESLTM